MVEKKTKLMLFSTQLKLKLKLYLSYHYLSWWAGGRVVKKKTKLMLYSTQLKLKLKLELSLAIFEVFSNSSQLPEQKKGMFN